MAAAMRAPSAVLAAPLAPARSVRSRAFGLSAKAARSTVRQVALGRGRLSCRASDDNKIKESVEDIKAAMAASTTPRWFSALMRNWGPAAGVPRADAKFDDIKDLLGGALFLALYKWFKESGPVYLLPTGVTSSFLVISDPMCAKQILRGYPQYEKGLVREVAEFLFGTGFAIAEGDIWKGRRRAVVPSLHKAYLEAMVERVFSKCTTRLEEKLEKAAEEGRALDMEQQFSQLTLDVIGLSVFNYDYNSLTADSPVIQAVYTALKETEQRATDLLPVWKVPFLAQFSPRQQKASEAVRIIRSTTEELIAKCKEIVEREQEFATLDSEYMNDSDPSVLRFLLASRVEVSEQQLRDDLLSMLVAGHETTGSVLTWTLKLLVENPEAMRKAVAEADRIVGDSEVITLAMTMELKYVLRCINESMRLYPHPPVLIRRASEPDVLPGGYTVPVGQDILISIYNIHRSPAVWDRPDDFIPERFPVEDPVPNESNTDFRYIPFSAGPRKCVGDQFALMEAVSALGKLLAKFEFEMVPGQNPGMTTGATIHTQNGLFMTVKKRKGASAGKQEPLLVGR